MLDQRLRTELIRDEGLRLEAYLDSLGNWTIGVGHLLGREKRMTRITMEESDAFLEVDLRVAESLARSCVPLFWQLTPGRQRALVNMAFNRGGHMRDSTTITPAINAAAASGTSADWSKVRAAIASSPWASQVGARAQRLADLLEAGA